MRVVSGDLPEASDILDLVQQDEGPFHDFKSDAILATANRQTQGISTIRQYVAGFANAEGGVLVIGVSNSKPRQLENCPDSIGSRPTHLWAEDVLREFAQYLQPPPRACLVSVGSNRVLLVACAAAPCLVPVRTKGRMVYFRRIGDSTAQLPDDIVADLLYGRRQHPAFRVELDAIGVDHTTIAEQRAYTLVFHLTVENVSLIDPDGLIAGLVGYSLSPQKTPVAQSILEYIDHEAPAPWAGTSWHLVHSPLVAAEEKERRFKVLPMHTRKLATKAAIVVPWEHGSGQLAAYVMALGSTPRWYQIDVRSEITGRGEIHRDSFGIAPCLYERPRVQFVIGPRN